MTMQAGKLDRQITILRKTETLSSTGDPVDVWAPIVRRRAASMWPLRSTERFSTPEKIATDQMDIRIRYSSDVADLTPLDRIIQPALVVDEDPEDAPARTVHEIIAVQEMGRREGLKIITERRPDIRIVDLPPATDGPSIDFSNPDNSMYISVI
jgi:head-tail adaptor